MAKNPLIDSKIASENRLVFTDERINPIPKMEVEIFDENDKPIGSFARLHIARLKGKIKINLIFLVAKPDTEFKEDEPTLVWYELTDKSSKEAYLRCEKEMVIKYICEKIFGTNSPFEVTIKNNISESLECEIKQAVNSEGRKINEIDVKIKKAGESDEPIQYANIRASAIFRLTKDQDYSKMITFPSSPPEKPLLTWGKIIGGVFIIVLISALIYYYRKKIWGWIKREDKTEKKEQVEIF